MHRRAALASSLLLLLTVLAAGTARAAPANDNFTDAQRIKGTATIQTNNLGATEEPSEPDHAGDPGGASIWYVYTATGDGEVTISTAGSDFDTLLAVYVGSTLSQLSVIVANDDAASGNLTSEVTFQATEGTTYFIAVDGKGGATGNIVLSFTTQLLACDITGTTGPDRLTGTEGADIICGLSGDDQIHSGGGDDLVVGGDGTDSLAPGSGDDDVMGGRGIDELTFRASPGRVIVDLVRGSARGEGADRLDGIENVIGSSGADSLKGDATDNLLSGGGGNDKLSGSGGNDQLEGGDGRDTASFSDGRSISVDLAFGRSFGPGIDDLRGIESVIGSPRADTIRGSAAKNHLVGGGGRDTIDGYAGNDKLEGGGDPDRIFGGGGRDKIVGGSGTDTCFPKACEKRAPYDDWLPVMNFYRSAVGLGRVMEDPALSAGDVKHSRYIVKTDQPGHFEDPNNRYYSEQGAIAGQSSNVFWSTSTAIPDRTPIDFWMSGPFHTIGMIAPGLQQVGYGIYREASSPVYTMAASLNIFGGLGVPDQDPDYPIMWPGDGSKVPLTRYPGNETPDPLTMCPGYQAPAGLPLLLVFDHEPNLRTALIRKGGSSISACAYEGARYRNPDPGTQSVGRAVLANAIVLIPRDPLARGASYEVVIDADHDTYRWSFKTSG